MQRKNDMQESVKQIYRNKRKYKGLILLDRDGTINKEVGYLQKKEQLALLPTVTEGIQLLNNNNIAVIVITNQPMVAHGLMTLEEVKEINNTLYAMLEQENAYLDAIYSCPHHPRGSVRQYSFVCHCRKPDTLLHAQAIKEYHRVEMLGIIGDSTRDIQLGKNLNIPTVLVQTGYKGKDGVHDVKADYQCKNFLSSVKKLLNNL